MSQETSGTRSTFLAEQSSSHEHDQIPGCRHPQTLPRMTERWKGNPTGVGRNIFYICYGVVDHMTDFVHIVFAVSNHFWTQRGYVEQLFVG